MTLYDVTPPAAKNVLVNYVTSKYGKSKAIFYVAGRTGANCQVILGNGRFKYDKCSITNHFFCEWPLTTQLRCEDVYDGSNPDFTANLGTPDFTACSYSGAISDDHSVINSNSFADDARVDLLSLNSNDIVQLPTRLYRSFPNLKFINCFDCRVTTLSYENLKGLKNLLWLDLLYSQITTLDSTVFRDVTNLLVLKLGK